MKPRIALLTITGINLLLVIGFAEAEIYKWLDEKGNAHFSDTAPANQKSEEVEIRINTFPAVEVKSLALWQRPVKKGKVIMYSASWCGICKVAKRYFKENHIPHKIYDVEKSKIGRKKFKRLGGRSVPIILVGNKRMNGFSVKRFRKLYEVEIVQKRKEDNEQREKEAEKALKRKAEIKQKKEENRKNEEQKLKEEKIMQQEETENTGGK